MQKKPGGISDVPIVLALAWYLNVDLTARICEVNKWKLIIFHSRRNRFIRALATWKSCRKSADLFFLALLLLDAATKQKKQLLAHNV